MFHYLGIKNVSLQSIMQKTLFFSLFIFVSLASRAQGLPSDTTNTDTTLQGAKMRELVVTKDRRLPVFPSKVAKDTGPRVKSLSEIIGAKATDYVMHPFAFKQRKKEKRDRKALQKLRELELIKTNDELLREALWREGIDPDSLLRARGAE